MGRPASSAIYQIQVVLNLKTAKALGLQIPPNVLALVDKVIDDPMRMWPISTRVNKPENDSPSILEPIQLATDAA